MEAEPAELATAPAVVEEEAEELAPGTTLGRFRIMKLVGRGGMGDVYLARDEKLDRPAAIKLFRPVRFPREQRAARLRREAQAMAQVSHPNVLEVYSVGNRGNRDYVAMEYVEGQSLRDWLRTEPHPWREVVKVFVEAGRGLAAVHEQGLTHRDFKPSNVLVGVQGRIRVADFGLACFAPEGAEAPATPNEAEPSSLLSAELTGTGVVFGTPRYMAPEQRRGRHGPASDQYAFCVSMYEALCGTHPTAKDGPTPPAAQGAVPGWLLRVLRRGLAKDPSRRWPSMLALVQRIAPQRSRLRLRIALGAGVVTSVSLVGIAMSGSEPCDEHPGALEDVWDNKSRDRVRAALLTERTAYAEDTAARVVKRLDLHVATWHDARRRACDAAGEALDARMACLRRRKEELKAVVEVLAAPGDGLLNHAIAVTASLQPSPEACATLLPDEATNIDAATLVARDRLAAMLARCRAIGEAGRHAEAMDLADEVRREASALGQEDLHARALLDLGRAASRAAKYERARDSLEEAVWLAGADPATAVEASMELVWLVGVQQGDPDEALRWADRAYARVDEANDSWRLEGRLETAIASIYSSKRDFDSAQEHLETALALYGDRDVVDRATILNNLGNVHGARGDLDLAEAYHQRALEVRQRELGPQNPDVGLSLSNLGNVALRREDADRAKDFYRAALEVYEASLGPDHPRAGATLTNLGLVLTQENKLAEAESAQRRALRIVEATHDEDHIDIARVLLNLARVYTADDRLELAAQTTRRAVTIRTRSLGEDHPATADAQQRLENLEALLPTKN